MTNFIQPMQPELVGRLPEGGEWQYEVKWDGYRTVAVKDGDKVTLYSRRRNDITDRYVAVARAVKKLPGNSVIDGEIVAVDSKGRVSFQGLQNSAARKVRLAFVAFDLLSFDGKSLLAMPLTDRQKILKRLIRGSGIQLSEPLDVSLSYALEAIVQFGVEGIVAKKRDSKYYPGARGGSWFKLRVGRGQEFVIGGVKEGDPFESLLVGYYEGNKLHYAGKVKAGLRPVIRRMLYQELEPLITDKCPFVNLPQGSPGRWGEGLTKEKMAECVWVRPKLVAQVTFVEWTNHGNLRHPKFHGLRDDKWAKDVVKESS
jgi:DNA ligase D-like protein (predicted ligase)